MKRIIAIIVLVVSLVVFGASMYFFMTLEPSAAAEVSAASSTDSTAIDPYLLSTIIAGTSAAGSLLSGIAAVIVAVKS